MPTIVSDPSTRLYKSKVVTDTSGIDNAGLGLFTQKKIREGASIMTYKGYRVRPNKVYRNKDLIDEYSMGNAEGKYVYCALNPNTGEMKSVAGYINDPLDDSLCNVKAVWRGKVCTIVAVCDIEAGEELLMAYGEDYWCQDKWSIRIIYKAWDNYATRRTQRIWQSVLESRRSQRIPDDSDPDASSEESEGEEGVVSRTPTSYRLIWDQLDFSKPYFGEPHPISPADLLPEVSPTITHCA